MMDHKMLYFRHRQPQPGPRPLYQTRREGAMTVVIEWPSGRTMFATSEYYFAVSYVRERNQEQVGQ